MRGLTKMFREGSHRSLDRDFDLSKDNTYELPDDKKVERRSRSRSRARSLVNMVRSRSIGRLRPKKQKRQPKSHMSFVETSSNTLMTATMHSCNSYANDSTEVAHAKPRTRSQRTLRTEVGKGGDHGEAANRDKVKESLSNFITNSAASSSSPAKKSGTKIKKLGSTKSVCTLGSKSICTTNTRAKKSKKKKSSKTARDAKKKSSRSKKSSGRSVDDDASVVSATRSLDALSLGGSRSMATSKSKKKSRKMRGRRPTQELDQLEVPSSLHVQTTGSASPYYSTGLNDDHNDDLNNGVNNDHNDNDSGTDDDTLYAFNDDDISDVLSVKTSKSEARRKRRKDRRNRKDRSAAKSPKRDSKKRRKARAKRRRSKIGASEHSNPSLGTSVDLLSTDDDDDDDEYDVEISDNEHNDIPKTVIDNRTNRSVHSCLDDLSCDDFSLAVQEAKEELKAEDKATSAREQCLSLWEKDLATRETQIKAKEDAWQSRLDELNIYFDDLRATRSTMTHGGDSYVDQREKNVQQIEKVLCEEKRHLQQQRGDFVKEKERYDMLLQKEQMKNETFTLQVTQLEQEVFTLQDQVNDANDQLQQAKRNDAASGAVASSGLGGPAASRLFLKGEMACASQEIVQKDSLIQEQKDEIASLKAYIQKIEKGGAIPEMQQEMEAMREESKLIKSELVNQCDSLSHQLAQKEERIECMDRELRRYRPRRRSMPFSSTPPDDGNNDNTTDGNNDVAGENDGNAAINVNADMISKRRHNRNDEMSLDRSGHSIGSRFGGFFSHLTSKVES